MNLNELIYVTRNSRGSMTLCEGIKIYTTVSTVLYA